ncbi:MAG: response regulator transcription factor [Ardenticatenales bacterium]|nr:response regulator transcription factor [Ardenticatenales bacterium]
MMETIRVLLADDHPLVRSGIRATLAEEDEMEVVGEAASSSEVLQGCESLRPHVLLLDLGMPGISPLDTIAYLQTHCPKVKILILTAYDDDAYIRGLLGAGVAGYILKDEGTDVVVSAIRTVVQGGRWLSQIILDKLVNGASPPANNLALTERERELLHLIAQGWDNTHIADALNLAHQTVRNYASRLYSKIGVQSRAEAIIWARARGITEHN